jgi:hypothetical protein
MSLSASLSSYSSGSSSSGVDSSSEHAGCDDDPSFVYLGSTDGALASIDLSAYRCATQIGYAVRGEEDQAVVAFCNDAECIAFQLTGPYSGYVFSGGPGNGSGTGYIRFTELAGFTVIQDDPHPTCGGH